jgi:CO/xanthine dehydrogenase Mo-binding subunit
MTDSNKDNSTAQLDRADFLKAAGAGALMVSFAMPGLTDVASAATNRLAASPYPALLPTNLDSWLTIAANGDAMFFTGKNDNGQGLPTAFRQIVAEELDLAFERVTYVGSDSSRTVNQGGASGSTGIANGGIPVRNAAAEARRVLIELASKKLGIPVSGLTVVNGVVSSKTDASKSVGYGELIGNQKFNVKLTSNNQLGNNLTAAGVAKPKDPATYTIVGKSIKRDDIEQKVFGTFQFTADVKVPGMLHARVVRPAAAGAKLVSVNGFPKKIPGLVKVIPMGKDAVAVIADREENAIKAAQTLRVKWSNPATPPFSTSETLFAHIRTAPTRFDRPSGVVGDVDKALAGAVKTIEAEYLWPFQSHSSMQPGVAVADYRPDKTITVWSGTQKSHQVQIGVAELLGIAEADVRVVWVQGSGSYGRNDADDTALEAAWLSKELGRPVRLQWMRHEGHAWDPKGPASVVKMRGGLDASGKVVAVDFDWKGFSGQEVGTSGQDAGDTLIGMALGFERPERNTGGGPADLYTFANKRTRTRIVKGFIPNYNPLRSTHIRDPQGPQSAFATESFMDELATAAGADPVAFRLAHLKDVRHRGVIEAVAKLYGWEAQISGSEVNRSAKVFTGRGISYAERGPTVVAVIADVEVTRATGKVWLKRVAVAVDAGLIINPDGMRNVIEGNVIHTASRTLKEEVRFSKTNVLSVNWETYPILNSTEMPERIDSVFVNNLPGKTPGGGGEPIARPVSGAIANAVFDATGIRARQVPLTPARMKALFKQAGIA